MNSYILLRDNKESTPLSLQGLQQMELKSTDLIWVECQSVCWRHPHEITELKMLVATVHQPAAEETEQPVTDKISAAQSPIVSTDEKKLVFVELPAADRAPVKKQEMAIPFTEPVLTGMHKYGGLTASADITAAKEIAPDINTKYSRLPGEIKETYARDREQDGQNKRRGVRVTLPKQFKQIAVYSGLVAAGALLMLLVTNSGRKRATSGAQNSTQTALVSPMTGTGDPGQELTDSIRAVNAQENTITKENISLPVEERQAVVAKTGGGDTRPAETVPDHPRETIAEKDTEPVTLDPAPKYIPAENISSQLTVNSSNYITGAFGGIRNLEMTLQNDSKYLLDKVTVEVKYLNLDGNTVHTEHLHFQSVQPGKTETIAVKKTKRGVKISYKITKIESREVNSSTAGL